MSNAAVCVSHLPARANRGQSWLSSVLARRLEKRSERKSVSRSLHHNHTTPTRCFGELANETCFRIERRLLAPMPACRTSERHPPPQSGRLVLGAHVASRFVASLGPDFNQMQDGAGQIWRFCAPDNLCSSTHLYLIYFHLRVQGRETGRGKITRSLFRRLWHVARDMYKVYKAEYTEVHSCQ